MNRVVPVSRAHARADPNFPGVTVNFNSDGVLTCTGATTVAQCGQAGVDCCGNLDQNAQIAQTVCPNHLSSGTCNADSNCQWLGSGSGTCAVAVPAGCCQQGTKPGYYIDPELGTVNIVCQASSSCTCCCDDPYAYPTSHTLGLQCDPAAPVVQTTQCFSSSGPNARACYANGG